MDEEDTFINLASMLEVSLVEDSGSTVALNEANETDKEGPSKTNDNTEVSEDASNQKDAEEEPVPNECEALRTIHDTDPHELTQIKVEPAYNDEVSIDETEPLAEPLSAIVPDDPEHAVTKPAQKKKTSTSGRGKKRIDIINYKNYASKAVTDEEEVFCEKNFKGDVSRVMYMRLHCTVCDRHIGCNEKSSSTMTLHRILHVLLCLKCDNFCGTGDYPCDEDESEIFCKWCGQGGNLLCCSHCTSVFCKKCLRRNLGRKAMLTIEESNDWSCLVCDARPIWEHRALAKSLSSFLKQQRDGEAKITPEQVENCAGFKAELCCQGEKPVYVRTSQPLRYIQPYPYIPPNKEVNTHSKEITNAQNIPLKEGLKIKEIESLKEGKTVLTSSENTKGSNKNATDEQIVPSSSSSNEIPTSRIIPVAGVRLAYSQSDTNSKDNNNTILPTSEGNVHNLQTSRSNIVTIPNIVRYSNTSTLRPVTSQISTINVQAPSRGRPVITTTPVIPGNYLIIGNNTPSQLIPISSLNASQKQGIAGHFRVVQPSDIIKRAEASNKENMEIDLSIDDDDDVIEVVSKEQDPNEWLMNALKDADLMTRIFAVQLDLLRHRFLFDVKRKKEKEIKPNDIRNIAGKFYHLLDKISSVFNTSRENISKDFNEWLNAEKLKYNILKTEDPEEKPNSDDGKDVTATENTDKEEEMPLDMEISCESDHEDSPTVNEGPSVEPNNDISSAMKQELIDCDEDLSVGNDEENPFTDKDEMKKRKLPGFKPFYSRTIREILQQEYSSKVLLKLLSEQYSKPNSEVQKKQDLDRSSDCEILCNKDNLQNKRDIKEVSTQTGEEISINNEKEEVGEENSTQTSELSSKPARTIENKSEENRSLNGNSVHTNLDNEKKRNLSGESYANEEDSSSRSSLRSNKQKCVENTDSSSNIISEENEGKSSVSDGNPISKRKHENNESEIGDDISNDSIKNAVVNKKRKVMVEVANDSTTRKKSHLSKSITSNKHSASKPKTVQQETNELPVDTNEDTSDKNSNCSPEPYIKQEIVSDDETLETSQNECSTSRKVKSNLEGGSRKKLSPKVQKAE